MCDAAKVRGLNDAFRKTLLGGRVVVTATISSRPELPLILNRVRSFADFTEDNDPYCEHDFGAFEHEGEQIFWKIDYYDSDLAAGSPDPADPTVTTRVLTIMLANEY